MATKVHMEALSPTMEEGQLVKWLKKEGDSVTSGEVLAEIETDKATMELVARGEGLLRKILLGAGGTAPVGEVIAVIAGADEDISGLVPDGESAPYLVPDVAPEAARDGDPGLTAEADAPGKQGTVVDRVESAPAVATDLPAGGDRLKVSPVARKLAEESALDLRSVSGSGPGGRIVKRDVEAVLAGSADLDSVEGDWVGEKSDRASVGPSPGPPPGVDFEDMPLSQMRKTIAKRLVESLGPVPHFFLRITVDMGRTVEARQRINGLLEAKGIRVSINDFILKATAHALAKHPEVNAQWTGEAIRRHYRVHLAVAVAVEDGLITPVVRDANLKGLAEISQEVRELAGRGQEKRLLPEEYTGSTFSVSNLGMFGIDEFTGVINPPEAGILAIGGIEETPVSAEGQVVIKPLMKVTMSCDHRVIDGATGARFLRTLKEVLEEPAALLV